MNILASALKWILTSALVLGAIERSEAGPATDTDPNPDKKDYTLFNPVPVAQMRDFSPDRPSLTDGPLTVDAGHFQIELGLISYSRDRWNSDHVRLDQFDFGQYNLRVGLLNNVELDLIGTLYSYVRTQDRTNGRNQLQTGFGDLTVRSKINLVGNQGGAVSFGLIPYLNLPTASAGLGANGVEGGLGLPVQFNLPSAWQLGLESSFNLRRSEESGVHWEYYNSITLGHPVIQKLSAYLEFYSQISTEAHQGWVGTVDGGLTYLAGKDFQIDGGVNVGVTKAAPDLQPFVGASWRF